VGGSNVEALDLATRRWRTESAEDDATNGLFIDKRQPDTATIALKWSANSAFESRTITSISKIFSHHV
jgi:hypothetical protein